MNSGINFNNLTAEEVIDLIQQSLSGNNQKIKHATKVLKTYTKHTSSIRILSFILINANDTGHRQMAAVLLKRNIVHLYEGLNPSQKQQFRNLLLSQYIKESSLLLQKGIATLVSLLLPVVQIKNWPELQQLLDQALKSAPDSAATFVLLNSILYHFKAPKQLYSFLLNALQTPNLVEQAIKCVVSVVQSQDDIDASLAIEFIKIWQKSSWSQQTSLVAIQILTTMIQRKIKLPDDVTLWICQKIIGNKKLSNRFRTAGCDYLFSLADCQPKLLASKQSLLKSVVQTICLTCAQPYHHKQDDQDGDSGQFVQEVALWLIQTLAVSIKAKKIYPVLFQAAVALINSNDVDKMNVGFLVLGSTCEGCAEKVKKNLQNPIMNTLMPKGLNCQAPEVRGAAIHALCYFSEHLIPDIFQYHSVVIPALMKYIGDLSPKVVSKALIAIDVFFDGMDQDDILQYLDVVIPKLNEVIASPNATALMKAASISAIGSAVQVSQQKFQPYLIHIMPACQYLLSLPPSPESNTVRSQNLNVLGKLANVFCKPSYPNNKAFYQTYIMNTMQTVYLFLLNQQDPQVRQSSFAFFYLIANAIGDGFEIVFDKLIPIVIAACQPKQAPQKNKDISLDTDSQDEDKLMVLNQKVTQHDQKASAIHALGQFAKSCPIKFTPYFQQAYNLLDQHYQHFYQNIRIQVCHCYTNLTIGLVCSMNQGKLPNIKKGLPCIDRYPPQLEELFRNKVIARLVWIMNQDSDQKVRGAATQSIDDMVKELGPAFIDRSLTPLTEAIMKLLQADMDQDDEEEDVQQPQGDDQDETQVHTYEAVCDLVPSLAQNLLAGFEPTLSQLHPYFLKYLEPRQQINDNVQMTSLISQCCKWCPGYAQNHAGQLFKALLTLKSLWDPQLNRNVAYCLAQMFQKASSVMSPYIQEGLISLKQIYQHKSSTLPTKQNAIAAICRIIYTINVPMPHHIFVDNLIKMMPFTGDQQQEGTAWKCIIFIFNFNPAIILPYRQSLIKIIENDLSNPKKYHLSQQKIESLRNFHVSLMG